MGLAHLIGEVASRDELAELLAQMEEENTRFRMAILWALGEHDEFEKPEGAMPYWWRKELRERAGDV